MKQLILLVPFLILLVPFPIIGLTIITLAYYCSGSVVICCCFCARLFLRALVSPPPLRTYLLLLCRRAFALRRAFPAARRRPCPWAGPGQPPPPRSCPPMEPEAPAEPGPPQTPFAFEVGELVWVGDDSPAAAVFHILPKQQVKITMRQIHQGTPIYDIATLDGEPFADDVREETLERIREPQSPIVSS
jgi:hypothetical protein